MNFLIFHEITFRARKMKKKKLILKIFLIFWEMESSSPKQNFLCIFREELPKPQKPKLIIFLSKKL